MGIVGAKYNVARHHTRPDAPLAGRQHINSLTRPDVNHPLAVTTTGFNHNWRADVNRRD